MTNKGLECLKIVNTLNSEIKSPFVIYADFESILVSENNRKQNPEDSYTIEFATLLIVRSRKVNVSVMR